MTHDDLIREAESLAIEMRKTNIRSYGLRVVKHEDWCARMRVIADGLKAMKDLNEKTPPPPPRLSSSVV